MLLSMSDEILSDIVYWRQRAEQARVQADRLADLESRRMMLAIAENYDRLADRAETLRSRH
jgi:hypothetical protein